MKKILIVCLFFIACKKSNNNTASVPTLPLNYISVIINGDTIKGTGNASGALQIIAPNGAKISFNIGTWYNMGREVVTSGSYNLSTGYYNTLGTFVESWASYLTSTDIFYTDASHMGSLSIIDTNNTITGTFNFVAIDSAGNTVNITNGVINKVGI